MSRYCYWRSPFISKPRCLLGIFVLILLFLMVLHYHLLPRISGTYNDECYLSEERRNDLRYAVQTIGKTMEKYNVTYWLDYGTLLGAERFRDVLPWDGDADISFLLTEEKSLVHEELLNYDISSNVLRAFYEGESIDYMRWVQRKGLINGREAIILHKYYPDSVLKHENAIVLYHHKLESFPLSWVKPTKTIDFHGVKLAIPNNPDSLLRHRYPWTYYTGLSIPYKWKCWIPCWIRTADGC